MLRHILFAMSATLLGGCYAVEENDQQINQPGSAVECKTSLSTGCVMGSIPASPKLRVDGKEFFDASRFGLQFPSLVRLTDSSGQAVRASESGYQIVLHTPVDNESFSQDFAIFLKGENARQAQTYGSGRFSVSYLEAGEYAIQVQKTIEFSVRRPEQRDEAGKVTAAAVDLHRCATIYQKDWFEVQVGSKTKLVMDNFKLLFGNENCGDDQSLESTVIVTDTSATQPQTDDATPTEDVNPGDGL